MHIQNGIGVSLFSVVSGWQIDDEIAGISQILRINLPVVADVAHQGRVPPRASILGLNDGFGWRDKSIELRRPHADGYCAPFVSAATSG